MRKLPLIFLLLCGLSTSAAIQLIKVGASDNDQTGDKTRVAYTKVNQNFLSIVQSLTGLQGSIGGISASNFVSVGTIAELRALPTTNGYTVASREGYLVRGDSPPVLYTYDPLSAALDEGGAIVGTNAVGRWVIFLTDKSTYPVQAWGAIVTNSVLQAAGNFVGSNGFGNVFVPHGTWNLKSDDPLTRVQLRSGVGLIGEEGTVLKVADAPTNSYVLINVQSVSNSSIQNVTLAGWPGAPGASTNTGYGISINDSSDVWILNFRSSGFYSSPINFGAHNTAIKIESAPAIANVTLYPSISTRTNYAIVAPYDTALVGAANFGPSAGQTSFEWLTYGHLYRIRQNGTIKQVDLYSPSLSGLTAFYLKVWRKNGANFDLVGTSENLLSSLVSGSLNDLTITGIPGVLEGDFMGARAEYSGASVQNFTTRSTIYATNYSVLNAVPGVTNYNWAGQTAANGVAVPMELRMTAPMLVTIGDSIVSGARVNTSFVDTNSTLDNPTVAMAYNIGYSQRWTYQNVGIGGNTIANIQTRFTNDVLNLHPRYVVLEGGVNDLLGSVTTNNVLAPWSAILSACRDNGIIPVVIGILPFRENSSATTVMLQRRDVINATLRILATTYGGYFVELDPILGKFWPGGDAGNLWSLQARYSDADHIHLSAEGQQRVAQAVVDVLTASPIATTTVPGTLTVNGGIALAGHSKRVIEMGRPIGNLPGQPLEIVGGGAAPGSTNQNGGPLIISSGVTTGTGLSQIHFKIPPLSLSSGSAENIPELVFDIERLNPGESITRLTSYTGDAIHRFYDGPNNYVGGVGYDRETSSIGLFWSNQGSVPILTLANDMVGIGMAKLSANATAPLQVVTTNSINQNDAVAKFYSGRTNGLWFGYDTNRSMGMIGSITEGVTHDATSLNPHGGYLGLGLGPVNSPQEVLHIYNITNGETIVRLESTNRSGVRLYSTNIYKGGFIWDPVRDRVGMVSKNSGILGGGQDISVDTQGRVGVGLQSTDGSAKFQTLTGTNTHGFDSAGHKFYTSISEGVWVGTDTDLHKGIIGATREGVANDPVVVSEVGKLETGSHAAVGQSGLTASNSLGSAVFAVGTSGQLVLDQSNPSTTSMDIRFQGTNAYTLSVAGIQNNLSSPPIGSPSKPFSTIYLGNGGLNMSGTVLQVGNGDPNGSISTTEGIFIRIDGGTTTMLYIKTNHIADSSGWGKVAIQ
jgi:lysophospholipase L1-like esterase